MPPPVPDARLTAGPRWGRLAARTAALAGAGAVAVWAVVRSPAPSADAAGGDSTRIATRALPAGPAAPDRRESAEAVAAAEPPDFVSDPAPGAPAPVGVAVRGLPVPLARFAVFATPGEQVPVEAAGPAEGDGLRAAGPGRWTWTAPAAPGRTALTLRDGAGTAVVVNALVRQPYDGVSTSLDGYELGSYAPPRPGNPTPTGFLRVGSPTDEAIPVSPHFRLGQFLCHQASGYPKFLLLDERLLLKLERLAEAMGKAGLSPGSLRVMSGYRTPAYNAGIGNETTYSAHLYGQAADVYADADGDGSMDDLDGDGAVTTEDARVLYRMAEALDSDPLVRGGLGLYAPAAHRGPFIHLDVRGRPARW